MKKILIGISLLAMGIVETLGIILCATFCLPSATAWDNSYPSKLFSLIFDGADGLGLGMFFSFGVVLIIVGLIILGIEYFRKESK